MKAEVTDIIERDTDRILVKATREDGQVITFHLTEQSGAPLDQFIAAVENPAMDVLVDIDNSMTIVDEAHRDVDS